jgi:hypothetical protein
VNSTDIQKRLELRDLLSTKFLLLGKVPDHGGGISIGRSRYCRRQERICGWHFTVVILAVPASVTGGARAFARRRFSWTTLGSSCHPILEVLGRGTGHGANRDEGEEKDWKRDVQAFIRFCHPFPNSEIRLKRFGSLFFTSTPNSPVEYDTRSEGEDSTRWISAK